VLRGKERDELQVLVIRDEVDVGSSVAIDRALIRDQPDALSAQPCRHIGQKVFIPGVTLIIRVSVAAVVRLQPAMTIIAELLY
jgi:hypothetical protein